MNKKIILISVFLFVLLGLFLKLQQRVFAAAGDNCALSSQGYYVSSGNNCKLNGYSCDNAQSVSGQAGCDALGGCYEEASWQMNTFKDCYFKADHTPIPEVNCGTIGLVCCPTGNQCTEGFPVESSSGLVGSPTTCYCESSTPTPKPTSAARGNVDYYCPGDKTGINTAIGCIHVLGGQAAALNDILKWATGVGGGIAFLLMLYAGFMIMTAQGNPERLKAGQELLTSAIAGLIMLIFSVFILKFIGIDILGLDKFGFGG